MVHVTYELWQSLLQDGRFCGLDVSFTVEESGGYRVQMSQEQYQQFMNYKNQAKRDDLFAVSKEAGEFYIGRLV